MSNTIVYLGLGSNSSHRHLMLTRARILINLLLGRISQASRLYSTAPWGYEDQDDFVNQVIELKTVHSVSDFHQRLLTIEQHLGKHKTSKYGPRNIDIDILIFGDHIIEEKELEIPHPRMHKRNFVLIPLAEIAPSAVHPKLETSISELRDICADHSEVKIEE